VLRRIMVDLFGFDVVMCMNITDIDDKIIIRAAGESFFQLRGSTCQRS
jgi:cysteinyl-tRNA synthetase